MKLEWQSKQQQKRYPRHTCHKSVVFYLTQLQSSDNGKNIKDTVLNFQSSSQSKMKIGEETVGKDIYDVQKARPMI